jgi:NAD-dependent deacetylase
MHHWYCSRCGKEYKPTKETYEELPYACDCGGLVRPDIVLFGEGLKEDMNRAYSEVETCDLFIVLGSSLTVYPVAYLPQIAMDAGAKVVIVNDKPTPEDKHVTGVLRQSIVPVLRAVHQGLDGIYA